MDPQAEDSKLERTVTKKKKKKKKKKVETVGPNEDELAAQIDEERIRHE